MDDVSMRRTIEQILHCVREALSVVENKEPTTYADDDLAHAQELIIQVRRRLKERN